MIWGWLVRVVDADICGTGKRLAMQELRIFIFHLMYNFEFLPLPEELQDMSASERIFRQPNMCHVRLKKL